MATVLVTGANGNLGRGVVEALRGSHVVIRSDITTDDPDPAFRRADATSPQAMLDVVTSDVDVLVHCPAWHGVHAYQRRADEYWALNVDGTYHAFTAAERAGVTRVVYASSAVIYGPVSNPYCFSKQVGEQVVTHFRDRCGMRVARLRYTAFTPPRDFVDYGVRMLDGGGLDRRDAAGATAAAVDALLADRFDDEAVDITAGTPFDAVERDAWATDPWGVLAQRWPDDVALLRAHLPADLPRSLQDPAVPERCRAVLGRGPAYDFGTFVDELRVRAAADDLSAPEGYSVA